MLKITNLVKTYNKGKANEIKVINDTSLELPSTGLVSFLGQSGSGKTTLLNAIGLLDKTDSGKIEYDDVTIDKYDMSKIDSFRSHYIGYIFQNYNLLPDISVEENLKVALDLINISGEEATKRIEYVLNAVGLYKYRKKPASALSGGQQQRVSIARCLVKNSKIIIADEPTGNLDSENTIEIMNILKKVSQNTLVLLVTHDRNIAEVYSSQVVEISDGVVTNIYKPLEGQALSKNKENTVYLKDLNSTKVADEKISMDVYSDSEIKDYNFKIVYVNGTYYIDSNLPIKLLKDSNVQVKNEHYADVSTKMNEDFEYDTSWYTNKEGKHPKYIKRSFINSVKEFFYTRKRTKFFHIAFFLIGILLGLTNYLVISNKYVDTKNFDTEKDAIVVNVNYNNKQDTIESIKKGIDDGIITDYYKNRSIYGYLRVDVNSLVRKSIYIDCTIYPLFLIEKYDYIAGRKPTSNEEIVIGKEFADNIIKKVGYGYTYELLLGLKINRQEIVGISSKNTNQAYSYEETELRETYFYEPEYTSSSYLTDTYGLRDGQEYEVIYGRDLEENESNGVLVCLDNDMENLDYFKSCVDYESWALGGIIRGIVLSTNPKKHCTKYIITSDPGNKYLPSYDLVAYCKDNYNYSIVQGREPETDKEVIINANVSGQIGDIYGEYTVVGKYQFTDEYPTKFSHYVSYKSIALLTNKGYLKFRIDKDDINYGYSYSFNGDDFNEIKDFFTSENVSARTRFESQYDQALAEMKIYTYISYAIIAVLVLLSIIYVYFTMRAKMVSDIYSIGVYRALGSSRSRINLKYIIDDIVLTLFTTFIGYMLFTLIFGFISTKINSIGGSLANVLTFPETYLFIPLIFVINLVFGLLPILMLLRKTPSEIISKYDI